MEFLIEFEQEEDGHWIADIPSLPGVMAYGATRKDAESKVEAIALRVIADHIERDHTTMSKVLFAVA
jgi:predicted RNase H-like HicB family nuclease